MEGTSFSPEQQERILTKDEIIEQYRDHYEEPPASTVVLADAIRELQPRFIQQIIIEEIEEDRNHYHKGQPFSPAIERETSIAIFNKIEDSGQLTDKTSLRTEWYIRKKVAAVIDEELRNETVRNYDHIALFTLDLNGLKALNDLYHRSAGDAYLQRVAHWLKASDTLQRLVAQGVTCTLARAGSAADEFMIVAKGTPSDDKDWDAIWSETSVNLQAELATLDVSDIWPAEELRKTVAERHIQDIVPIPDDLRFQASAGFGRATLEHVLSTGEGNPDRRVTRNDSADSMANKLTGAMIDVSLAYMKKHKQTGKEDPFDEHDRALIELLRSTGR